jgi:hypothetical protein
VRADGTGDQFFTGATLHGYDDRQALRGDRACVPIIPAQGRAGANPLSAHLSGSDG